jgi:hypothetical protein
MDIKSLAVSPSTVVHLKHPASGEPLYDGGDRKKPVTVSIYGPGSAEFRAVQSQVTNENLARRRKGVTAESMERSRVEVLARCTFGFGHFEYEGKGYSVENARALYSDPSMVWVREQVEEATGDLGNFLETPSGS